MDKEKKIKYFHDETTHNVNAPNEVVPHLMQMFKPLSVLDVGCGIGTWLNVFLKNGVTEVHGIDGDFVDRKLLYQYINPEQFSAMDLIFEFDLKKSFDLVICLEVAEHLPASSANGFISSLCRHSDTIVFSAAVPWQGGQNHINEQWKDYWINLFNEKGFTAYDLLRPLIWNNKKVEWWYKQNILVFSKNDLSLLYPEKYPVLEIIHPDLFMEKLQNYQDYVSELQQQLWNKKE